MNSNRGDGPNPLWMSMDIDQELDSFATDGIFPLGQYPIEQQQQLAPLEDFQQDFQQQFDQDFREIFQHQNQDQQFRNPLSNQDQPDLN